MVNIYYKEYLLQEYLPQEIYWPLENIFWPLFGQIKIGGLKMEEELKEMLEQIKKTNQNLEELSKDIKQMKGFLHQLSNKLGGL